MEVYRRRRAADKEDGEAPNKDCSQGDDPVEREKLTTQFLSGNTYWLTRIIFTRALGFVYFVAFLVAVNQNKELLGKHGLLPLRLYLDRIRSHFEVPPNASTNFNAFSAAPSLLWWVGPAWVDVCLDAVAWSGVLVSGLMVLLGRANALLFALLWVLYHSLVNIGQRWYSFGWESQLLETGFLAIFMCPLISLKPLPRATPTSWVVVWGNRWLLFRIMLGAGLIKIRGDQCWRDLTCMNYHYETQPVPNPLSYYLHQSPELLHKAETLGNHFVELVVPFFMLLPRPFRLLCGTLQILFQVVLILSGNLSFLNWLTILPAIFCFDDLSVSSLFSSTTVEEVRKLQEGSRRGEKYPIGFYIRKVSSVFLGLLLAYLSIPVVQNLLSSNQLMNTSFDSLKIVNTYGAFGSITKERTEVILEGTLDDGISSKTQWVEIEFKCKPGHVKRRPCIISPYHYRLDWLMWFSAFQTYQYNPWLLHLAGKMIAGDPEVRSLLRDYPFKDTAPRFVRAQHYRYRYTKIGSKEAKEGQWWQRTLVGEYFPPVSEAQLRPLLERQGWKWYTPEEHW